MSKRRGRNDAGPTPYELRRFGVSMTFAAVFAILAVAQAVRER